MYKLTQEVRPCLWHFHIHILLHSSWLLMPFLFYCLPSLSLLLTGSCLPNTFLLLSSHTCSTVFCSTVSLLTWWSLHGRLANVTLPPPTQSQAQLLENELKYAWFFFLILASGLQVLSSFLQMSWSHLSLEPSKMPLHVCGGITFSLFIQLLKCVGWFHFLVIGNRLALNMNEQIISVECWLKSSSGKYPGVAWRSHMVVLLWDLLWGSSILFPW